MDEQKIKQGWEIVLDGLGLSLDDPNLKDTPARMARSYAELFRNIGKKDWADLFKCSFPSNYSGLVMVDNVRCFGMCPHHFLPVEYTVTVGYVSTERMIGISKLARIVEEMSKEPILQETLTENIAHTIQTELGAVGVMVVVRGMHYCMRMRGVKKADSVTVTSSVKGDFEKNPALRQEFMSLIKK